MVLEYSAQDINKGRKSQQKCQFFFAWNSSSELNITFYYIFFSLTRRKLMIHFYCSVARVSLSADTLTPQKHPSYSVKHLVRAGKALYFKESCLHSGRKDTADFRIGFSKCFKNLGPDNWEPTEAPLGKPAETSWVWIYAVSWITATYLKHFG